MKDYTTKVLQEPVHGRMCGFTNLPDRRMLYVFCMLSNFVSDPPLVVQLSFPQSHTSQDETSDR